MPRYKAILEYDGGGFVGWQRQDNGPSVQEAVEDALASFCGEEVTVFAAGRTDAGVHASGQCVHFNLTRAWVADKIGGALNFYLRPKLVAVLAVELAADDFDARFQAKSRQYLYRIINRRAPLALHRGRAWQVSAPLDAAAMHQAARCLLGRHDFTTFRAAHCQAKSPQRTLERLEVVREGDDVLVLAEARSFLHNQVRSMVGTLKLVGEGKWTADRVGLVLAARDRAACGPVAPPDGLYLTKVVY